MEINLIGASHSFLNADNVFIVANRQKYTKVGLEISKEDLAVFEELYSLKSEDFVVDLLKLKQKLYHKLLEEAKQRGKNTATLEDYILDGLKRIEMAQNPLGRAYLEAFDTGELYYYSLYKQFKEKGIEVVPLESSAILKKYFTNFGVESNEIFLKKARKTIFPVREAYMAYQIAKCGVDLAIVGTSHILGRHGLYSRLSNRGYKVNKTIINPGLSWREMWLIGRARKKYYRSVKKTHDAWWKRLKPK